MTLTTRIRRAAAPARTLQTARRKASTSRAPAMGLPTSNAASSSPAIRLQALGPASISLPVKAGAEEVGSLATAPGTKASWYDNERSLIHQITRTNNLSAVSLVPRLHLQIRLPQAAQASPSLMPPSKKKAYPMCGVEVIVTDRQKEDLTAPALPNTLFAKLAMVQSLGLRRLSTIRTWASISRATKRSLETWSSGVVEGTVSMMCNMLVL